MQVRTGGRGGEIVIAHEPSHERECSQWWCGMVWINFGAKVRPDSARGEFVCEFQMLFFRGFLGFLA